MATFLDRLIDLLGDKDPVPNKLTIGMGKLIREAREEVGISQAKLASTIYRRRATISNIETGKSEVTISTLTLISAALEKPITYFLPWFVYENLKPEDFSPLEQEILVQFRKIWSDDLKRLAIRQTKDIAGTSLEQFRKDRQKLRKDTAKDRRDD